MALPAPDEATTKSAFPLHFASAAKEIATAKAVMALGERTNSHAKKRAEKAGILVLGRRGLGSVRETLLGSVSQEVLHQADCTVVIVK